MTVTGHKVLHFDLDEDRKVVREREFMTGVLPIDVTFGPNGYLYVADMSGQIYEVRHVADTPEVVQVDIRCLPGTGTAQFVPALTSVVRGQTVQWTNLCSTPQNVTGEHKVKDVNPLPGGGGESPYSSGSRINSGPIPPGGTHSHTFDGETAVYHYHSTVTALDGHTARGTIVVTPLER